MGGKIRLTKANCVPEKAYVCHYDELEEPAKECFPALARSAAATSEPELVASIERYDYVKFTEYYRVHSAPCAAETHELD